MGSDGKRKSATAQRNRSPSGSHMRAQQVPRRTSAASSPAADVIRLQARRPFRQSTIIELDGSAFYSPPLTSAAWFARHGARLRGAVVPLASEFPEQTRRHGSGWISFGATNACGRSRTSVAAHGKTRTWAAQYRAFPCVPLSRVAFDSRRLHHFLLVCSLVGGRGGTRCHGIACRSSSCTAPRPTSGLRCE
jgi:hypothetical protein